MVLRDILHFKGRDVFTTTPQDTVYNAAQKLVSNNIRALPVVNKQNMLTGIITAWDILRLTTTNPNDFNALLVGDYMTREVYTAGTGASVDTALCVMNERHIHHIPIVEEGNLIGMVSQGDLVRARLENVQLEPKHMTNFVLTKYPV
ncbi:CBS domain-containing protein [candidate division KSB1 bacterium]|nr:MAG: CBS domain-containing protein [candidate division KSB1 bacterium]